MFHGYLEEMKELGLKPGGNDWNRIGAVKLFADGAVGGRTALLKEPYHDAPHTRGLAMHTFEELRRLLAERVFWAFPLLFMRLGTGGSVDDGCA